MQTTWRQLITPTLKKISLQPIEPHMIKYPLQCNAATCQNSDYVDLLPRDGVMNRSSNAWICCCTTCKWSRSYKGVDLPPCFCGALLNWRIHFSKIWQIHFSKIWILTSKHHIKHQTPEGEFLVKKFGFGRELGGSLVWGWMQSYRYWRLFLGDFLGLNF